MAAEFTPTTYTNDKSQTFDPMYPIAAVVGLGSGALLTFLFNFVGLVALAMWPLGLAIGLIATGYVSGRLRHKTHFGLLLVGQMLAILGIGLILVAAIS